ncbi:hypothetical protein E2C01_054966 [Portunus trituberculatus]|uniref:Uncharacterized protein n=1 Tax=Portunus trituberculatus TaxID=210409 RepID=A0A5B7GTL1_PORTR|nr:hypothetical protein [Portunus trituberculatus]
MLQGSVQLPLYPHRGWIPPPSQSREPHDNPVAPQEWPILPLPQRASEWTLVSRKKKRCSSSNPAQTASPEPD